MCVCVCTFVCNVQCMYIEVLIISIVYNALQNRSSVHFYLLSMIVIVQTRNLHSCWWNKTSRGLYSIPSPNRRRMSGWPL